MHTYHKDKKINEMCQFLARHGWNPKTHINDMLSKGDQPAINTDEIIPCPSGSLEVYHHPWEYDIDRSEW